MIIKTDDFFSLINEVLAVKSDRELVSVVEKYPHLLSVDLLAYIKNLQREVEVGAPASSEAVAIRVALVRLVYHKNTNLGEGKLDESAFIEPEVPWALSARSFIARGLSELMEQAIKEAQKQDEPDIAEYLRFYLEGNIPASNASLRKVVPVLHAGGRHEEALTLELITRQSWALIATIYDDYPPAEQIEKRDIGVGRCLEAIRLSCLLQDLPCRIYFINNLGTSFKVSGIPSEAIYYFAEALQICRELMKSNFSVFSHYVLMNLREIGQLLTAQKRWQEAEVYFDEALQLASKMAETDLRVFKHCIDVALRLGNVLFYQQKWRETVDCYLYWLPWLQKMINALPSYLNREIVEAFNNCGFSQLELNDYDHAEDYFRSALFYYRELEKNEKHEFTADIARTTCYIGVAKFLQSAYPEAENHLFEALDLYRDLGVGQVDLSDKDLCIALQKIGEAKTLQGKWAEVESFYSDTLKLYSDSDNTALSSVDYDKTWFLINLGEARHQLGKFSEAEQVLKEAIALLREFIAQTASGKEDLAIALNLLGCAQNKQLKQIEAEKSFVEALVLCREVLVKDSAFRKYLAMFLNNFGLLLHQEQRFQEAKLIMREAVNLNRELAKDAPDLFNFDVAVTLNTLGNILRDQHMLNDAEKIFLEALEFLGSLPEVHKNLVNKMLILNNLGLTQNFLGKKLQAEENLRLALKIGKRLEESEPHVYAADVAMILMNLSYALVWQKKWKEAEVINTASLKAYIKLAAENPYIFNRNVAKNLSVFGFLYFYKGDLDKSLDFFNQSVDLIESLRKEAKTFDDRNRLMQEFRETYDGLLTCYHRQGSSTKLLEIAERGKSRSLMDLLNLKTRKFDLPLVLPEQPEAVVDLKKKYKAIVSQLQVIESTERDSVGEIYAIEEFKDDKDRAYESRVLYHRGKLDYARHARFDLSTKLNEILKEIREFEPDFPPKVEDITSERIFELSETLNRAIVMFRVMNKSTLLIFVLPTRELVVKEIKTFDRSKLWKLYSHNWMEPYIKLRSDRSGLENWKNSINKTLDKLDRQLMRHVRDGLSVTNVSEVLLVPNLMLALLPLHAASWKDKQGNRRFFLEKYTVSYAPSISVFNHCLYNQQYQTGNAVFVVNPTGDLQFSEKEVKEICQLSLFNTKLILKSAVKRQVLKTFKDHPSFIHFSCHGFHDIYNTFESGINLADDVLRLREILNLDLKGNSLTALSACESGMVDFRSLTDEHFSLPIGFIFAGSPSVWASLWAVNDYATSLLMIKAYEKLAKNENKYNKAEALRLAQLDIMKYFDEPYYWAGFQHFGI